MDVSIFDIILGYILLLVLAISSLVYAIICVIEMIKSWKEKRVFSNILHLVCQSLLFVLSIGSLFLIVVLALP